MKRDDHPYTALLTREDQWGVHYPKIEVRLSDGSRRMLRPRWIAKEGVWCVQRWGCPQRLARVEDDWPKWKTL